MDKPNTQEQDWKTDTSPTNFNIQPDEVQDTVLAYQQQQRNEAAPTLPAMDIRSASGRNLALTGMHGTGDRGAGERGQNDGGTGVRGQMLLAAADGDKAAKPQKKEKSDDPFENIPESKFIEGAGPRGDKYKLEISGINNKIVGIERPDGSSTNITHDQKGKPDSISHLYKDGTENKWETWVRGGVNQQGKTVWTNPVTKETRLNMQVAEEGNAKGTIVWENAKSGELSTVFPWNSSNPKEQTASIGVRDGKVAWMEDRAGRIHVNRDGKDKILQPDNVHPLKEPHHPSVAFEKHDKDGKFEGYTDRGKELVRIADQMLAREAKGREVSAVGYGNILNNIAGQKDLTEREKLFVHQKVVDQLFAGRDGAGKLIKDSNSKYVLTTEGMTEVAKSTVKDPTVIRHQVLKIGFTLDGEHGTKAIKEKDPYEAVKQHAFGLKTMRDLAVDWGDYWASLYQVKAISEYQKDGFAGYAKSWNQNFLQKNNPTEYIPNNYNNKTYSQRLSDVEGWKVRNPIRR